MNFLCASALNLHHLVANICTYQNMTNTCISRRIHMYICACHVGNFIPYNIGFGNFAYVVVVIVIIATENIPQLILSTRFELVVLERIKIRIRAGYVKPIVVGVSFYSSGQQLAFMFTI